MLTALLSGGDWRDILLKLAVKVFIVFCILPIHEFAHAFIAYKLGDHTARLSGRLTLNPLAHIDPIGGLMLLLAGFGYAKAVPVNMRNFKNPKGGMALVALAGPASNLIMATAFTTFSVLIAKFGYTSLDSGIVNALFTFTSYAAIINVNLAVFNLLPIPPLDGSRIMNAVLPDRIYFRIMQYERYIMIGLLLLMILPIGDFIWSGLGYLSNAIFQGIFNLIALPFGIRM